MSKLKILQCPNLTLKISIVIVVTCNNLKFILLTSLAR